MTPTTDVPPKIETRQEIIDDVIQSCEMALENLRKRRVIQAISGLFYCFHRAEEAEAIEPTTYDNQD